MKIIITLFAVVSLNFVAIADNLCAISKQNAVALNPVASSNAMNLQNKYDTKFHHLNLNLARNSRSVSGNVKTLAKVVSLFLDTFAFELHPNFTIDSILVNGINSPFSRSAGDVFVPVNNYTQNDLVSVQTFYNGMAPTGASAAIGNGYSTGTSQSWGNVVSWSLSQPYAAYEWWPCKQQLTDKIDSSWVFVTTDSINMTGSNGVLTNVVNLNNGKKRFEWKSKNPINYYLISVATARYIDYSYYAHPANSDSVLIQNFIYNNPQTLPNFLNDINDTGDMLELFADLFGPYPFANEKYGHCMAPFSGGMEHQTMTSQGFFNFTLTAHELGHQWFGDYVTCKTWSDIFVNEGMASYTEYLALQYLQGQAQAKQQMDGVISNVISQPDGSIYFTDTASVSRIFSSRLSYDKGAAVMHTLRFVINNDTLFFNSLKNYLNQYAHSNASINDFITVFENTCSINLSDFKQQWIYGQGYPTFSAEWNSNNNLLNLQVSQTPSAPSFTALFKTPLEIKLTRSIGDTTIRVNLNSTSDIFSIPVNGTVNALTIDPNNYILKSIGTISNNPLLAVKANNKNTIKLSPNPVKSGDAITFSENISAIVLVKDISGKVVLEKSLVNENKFQLNNFVSGIYFLELNFNNSGKEVHKFSIVE
ncbi:MAG: M1 family aminopeptidase [Bacteroidota bacterium]